MQNAFERLIHEYIHLMGLKVWAKLLGSAFLRLKSFAPSWSIGFLRQPSLCSRSRRASILFLLHDETGQHWSHSQTWLNTCRAIHRMRLLRMGGWVRYRLTSSNARLYSSVQLVTFAPLSVRKKGLDLHVKQAMKRPNAARRPTKCCNFLLFGISVSRTTFI